MVAINTLMILFSTIIFINLILISAIVILEKKRPEKTIAWILILLLLPPIGLILYIFLGRNWKLNTLNKGITNNLKKLINPIICSNNDTLKDYPSLVKLLAANSYSPLFINNKVYILNGGKEKFKFLKNELIKAKHHIHLEYYIVKNDKIGNEIKDILIDKVKQGVEVRFIIDKMGSIKLKKSYIKELKQAGVDVVFYTYIFAPLLRLVNTQVNYRNHRKIVVIDGSIGFIGGINIGDEYLGKGKLGEWRDCHIMIKGDAVLALQATFLDDYSSIKKCNSENLNLTSSIETYFSQPNSTGNTLMQVIKSGPNSEFPSIMQSMIKMISMAEDYINIVTPYFIPSEGLIDALRIASLSGIKVTIIFPEQADHFTVNHASITYLAELMRCGAKVYLYNKKGFVHSKFLIIDGEICNIGTANMDIRSFELNYEINTVIYDKKITTILNNIFYKDLNNCREYTLKEYDKQSIFNKMLNGLCRLLSSIL
ncbi:Putative Cardiolipin synthetase [Clostridium chauvoei JF4335]|uniref:Cardiolipin synthase n=2 Tax=Clostridium chauvoei TaxID=46867 RepID=A0A1U6JS24_9CLOT|nr:Putative Cardiolipin synthetase [Clostridium chauvoei JF4335]